MNMGFFSELRNFFLRSAYSELPKYLRRWILHGHCPVCQHKLDANHSVTHVGSCNFPGPNPENGFIADIRARNWGEIVKPFFRIPSQDMMSCDVIHCPQGFALLVWVEVDLVLAGDQYPVYIEQIEENEMRRLSEFVEPRWQRF
jgi:hypothetical protein